MMARFCCLMESIDEGMLHREAAHRQSWEFEARAS
jgi:hypothetical protein